MIQIMTATGWRDLFGGVPASKPETKPEWWRNSYSMLSDNSMNRELLLAFDAIEKKAGTRQAMPYDSEVGTWTHLSKLKERAAAII